MVSPTMLNWFLEVLVNNQPDALIHVFIYSFHLSTCFEHQVLIIMRSNCINTSSGMISLCKWLLGMPVYRHTKQSLTQTNHTTWCINTIQSHDDEHLMLETCREVKLINKYMNTGIPCSDLHRLIIPDDVLIQFDLMMMSTWCLKHVERWNEKINTWISASGWLLTRICDEMCGQQNIKWFFEGNTTPFISLNCLCEHHITAALQYLNHTWCK